MGNDISTGIAGIAKIARYGALAFGILFFLTAIGLLIAYFVENSKGEEAKVNPHFLLFLTILFASLFIFSMIVFAATFIIAMLAPGIGNALGDVGHVAGMVAPLALM